MPTGSSIFSYSHMWVSIHACTPLYNDCMSNPDLVGNHLNANFQSSYAENSGYFYITKVKQQWACSILRWVTT